MAEHATGEAIVRTIAGDPNSDAGHKDTFAPEALFTFPTAVVVDDKDGLFVADANNNCIRYVSPDRAEVKTVAGVAGPRPPSVLREPGDTGHKDGPALEAQFEYPTGVALDSEGGLFVADADNHCIRYVSPDRTQVMTVAGGPGKRGTQDGAPREAKFSKPICVAVDGEGGLLVGDYRSNCIRHIAADRTQVMTVAGVPSTEGHEDGDARNVLFRCPTSVAIDDEGGLFVADADNHCIRYVSPDRAEVTTIAGVAGDAGHKDGPALEAQFDYPCGVAFDGEGGLLVADQNNNCIRHLSPDRTRVLTVAGVPGKVTSKGHKDGLAREAQFDTPKSVAVDSKGDLLVADTNNRCIRIVENLGLIPPCPTSSKPDTGGLEPEFALTEPEPEPNSEPEPDTQPASPTEEGIPPTRE